jgi:hypothetical protein
MVDLNFVEEVTDLIVENLKDLLVKKGETSFLTVEETQDEVEKVLMSE